MSWFYKDNNLYVPIGDHEKDPKWRQRLCGVKGLDEDLTENGHYIVKDARKLKVKEMKADEDLQYQYMLIDCYSYLFGIGNACSYVPKQNRLILIDERPMKREVGGVNQQCTSITCSDNSMYIGVVKVFEKAIDRMVYDFDELNWYEGNELLINLQTMLEAKGWLFPKEEVACCFCGGPCNPQSQSCGVCARKLW
jgi:hypothetical protein